MFPQVARGRQRKLWVVTEQFECQAGGVPCLAVRLERLEDIANDVKTQAHSITGGAKHRKTKR